jgi:hypothetical protein
MRGAVNHSTPVGGPQGETAFAERGSPVRGDAGLAGCCAGLSMPPGWV